MLGLKPASGRERLTQSLLRGRVPVADSGEREALEALRRIADGEQFTEKYGSGAVHDGEGWKEAVYVRPITVQEFARRVLSHLEGEPE